MAKHLARGSLRPERNTVQSKDNYKRAAIAKHSARGYCHFVNAGGLGVINPNSRAFSTAAVREWTLRRKYKLESKFRTVELEMLIIWARSEVVASGYAAQSEITSIWRGVSDPSLPELSAFM